jgi:2-keto-4-pentenoate hydratase/2-oxohepta-3-ene-1,7-dioic acid hydratase in catechol pathway
MKLAHVEAGGRRFFASVTNDEVIDLTSELKDGFTDVLRICTQADTVQDLAQRCQKKTPRLPLGSVRLLAPVPDTSRILGVGMNYHSFVAAAQRAGLPLPASRIWFLRPRCCITGPYDDVWLPQGATDLDYENELTIVIGRRCRAVSVADARQVIGGFTVGNDMTLRSLVARSLVFAKSFETHTPLGPWIVTPDELDDVGSLALKTWVNGELRQNGTTADMVASGYELIAEISSVCALNPGDLIMTGTPDGCGIFARPPQGLAPGDVVRLEIEGIGAIENRIVAEPAAETSSVA